MKFSIALTMILTVILATVVAATAASALSVTVTTSKLDGQDIWQDDIYRIALERGQEFEFKVTLVSAENLSNIQAEAYISGYEYSDYDSISDTTHNFDMESDVSYTKTFKLKLPNDIEQDSYKLRLLISDRYGGENTYDYNLKIDAQRHAISFYDILVSPDEEQIVAGRALTATVRLENTGEKDEENVKVTASIPKLGVSDSAYIDLIKSGDDEETEELYMRIPTCATPGIYDLVVEANYDKKHETIKETSQIQIIANEDCSQNSEPLLALSSDSIAVDAGKIASFTVTITNNAVNSKTYTLVLSGADGWSEATVSPSATFVVGAKESKQVRVDLAADKKASGLKELLVKLSSEGKQAAQIAIDVDVAACPQGTELRTVLEIVLVVLVALLVIIALLFGFKSLGKKSKVYY